jgi:hypothetical protein
MVDRVNRLNQLQLKDVGDPEIATRISQYEMAYRMQSSVPELMDTKSESKAMHALYGSQPGKASFANNCLLARRLVERGVRFVQLFDQGWGRDHHAHAFTLWMAGGGVKGGTTYGETDELGYRPVENPVHVHDFNATIMHLLGMDHEQLTFRYQGRPFRLTDIAGQVVRDICV